MEISDCLTQYAFIKRPIFAFVHNLNVFLNVPTPVPFSLFSSFSQYKYKLSLQYETKLKKRRCCAWDSNLGMQDERMVGRLAARIQSECCYIFTWTEQSTPLFLISRCPQRDSNPCRQIDKSYLYLPNAKQRSKFEWSIDTLSQQNFGMKLKQFYHGTCTCFCTYLSIRLKLVSY